MNKCLRLPGFSVVELLIVVLVIAILATLSAIGYKLISDDAKQTAAVSSLKQVEDSLKTEMLKKVGIAPPNLNYLTSLPKNPVPAGFTTEYHTYDNMTNYCLALVPPASDNVGSYFVTSFGSRSPEKGKCSDPISSGPGFLGYSDVKGASVMFPETKPLGDLTLYSAFEISNMDGAWSSMAGGVRGTTSVGQTLQLDQSSAGHNGLRVRADTTLSINAAITQTGVRGNGKHVGWTQVSSSVTRLALGYDTADEIGTRALIAGNGMPFAGVALRAASTGMNPLGAIMFDKAHTKEERSRVLQWLARAHSVPGAF